MEPREWLVIENSSSRSVFADDDAKKPAGYIPRDSAEKVLRRDLGGRVWFTREESDLMRRHPEFRETEPPGRSPSASAPDGPWEALEKIAHCDEWRECVRIADTALATRPPAIDGQAWPSEFKQAVEDVLYTYVPDTSDLGKLVRKYLAAAPPAQDSAGWRDGVEAAAQCHMKAAEECELIAAVNQDNELGTDCITRAADHRIYAAAIRSLAPPVEEAKRSMIEPSRSELLQVTRPVEAQGSGLIALRLVVDWWDALPPGLRQDIEGSGRVPGCIARAKAVLGATDARYLTPAERKQMERETAELDAALDEALRERKSSATDEQV